MNHTESVIAQRPSAKAVYSIISGNAMIIKMNRQYLSFLIFSLIFSSYDTFSQTDSLDIYELNLNQLSKLKITSASKVVQNINEVPSTIFVITGAQIKENGYFTLEAALADLPGFQFRNILGINSYVFQRGIPNQNNLTLLLIDGVQVNELNSGGFYAGGQYNLSNVERIEVIYGPSSVTYGTNAVTGIINIITKSSLEKRAEINTLMGSFNTAEGDFNFSIVNKKKTIGVSAAGMFKKSDKADLKEQAGDYNWTDLMNNFENDYTFDLKVQIKDFILGANYQYKQSSTATLVKSTGTTYRDYGTSWNIQFLNNYLKYNKKISSKLFLSSVLYNRNATVLPNTVYYVVDTAQIGYYRPNNLTGLENVLNYDATGFFSLTGGLTFEYEQLAKKNSSSFSDSPEHKPFKPEKPEMVDNTLVSVFVEPRFTLFKKLFLSAGLRFDQSSIYDHVLTPRAGLIYHFRKHSLRFSYSEAFRAPKPWDYSDGLGNPSLLPEKMKSLEAALAFSFFNDFKVELIGYGNKLGNAITNEVTNSGYLWVNSGEISTKGFEIYLRYSSRKLTASLTYTYNQSLNKSGEFVPEISKHSGNTSITYSFNQYLKINLRANYIGQRENPKLVVTTNSFYIEPCLIFHGTVSFLNYKGFTARLIVNNILNTKYFHTSNRAPDRYRQPQRTIMLSVGYALNK
jgi:outer membrane receptor for ferrienterochelin and colicin